MSWPHVLIAFVCLISGGSALIYQAVWTREMTLVVGAASQAVSLVLAVFMGGLALGSWAFGCAADRSRVPLRFYGAIELAIAALGFLSVPALEYLTYAPGLSPLWRKALACGVLLAPAALMGGTLPALTRAVCRSASSAGEHSGRLYALNTLGAVVGIVLATFVLIERSGLRASVHAAVLGNLIAGTLALLFAGSFRADPLPAEAPRAPAPERSATLALAVVGLSGFLALAAEVLWTRYLILVVNDNSVYAFSTMLAAFLTGLVLGSAAASRLGRRSVGLRLFLGAALALGAAATLAGAAVLEWLVGPAGLKGMFWREPIGRFLKCLMVLLVPAALSGALLPLAVQFHARRAGAVGREFGAVYAVNTCGAILGALAGGFLILPGLGLRGGLVLLASLGGAAGLAVLLSHGRPASSWKSALACTLALVAAFGAASRAGDHSRQGLTSRGELLFYEDGPDATVAVTRSRAERDNLTLLVDWRDEASTGRRYQIHLRLLGHLPALFHPTPRRGLVVAFGAGVTAGSLARHPFEEIDVIELSPAVVHAAPLFAPFNDDPLGAPTVALRVGDGRNFLLSTGKTYDVITTDPVNPETAGGGNLYSREFYELVREHLTEHGVACQWLPSHYRVEEYKMLVRTFQAVFPNTSIRYGDGTTVLVGSKSGPAVTLADLRLRWREQGVSESLAVVGIDSPEALLPLLLAGPDETRRLAGEGPLTTDDRPRIEYRGHVRGLPDPTPKAWELLAELPPPAFGSVVAGWSAADARSVAAGREAVRSLFARHLLRRNLAPRPNAPEVEWAAFLEEGSRRYLDDTWRLAEADIAPVYRMMSGLSVPESFANGSIAGTRGALIAAAREDRLGRPIEALDRLLAADLSSPELATLPQRMTDMVVRAIEARPKEGAVLGKQLLERLPEGRNRPSAEEAGDVVRWRRWWTRARINIIVVDGRFAWKPGT